MLLHQRRSILQFHYANGIRILSSCLPQVSETLSDEARESQSVGQLKRQLLNLQTEVDAASQRLAQTKARVAHNMQRVDQLKAEAVRQVPAVPAVPMVSAWQLPGLIQSSPKTGVDVAAIMRSASCIRAGVSCALQRLSWSA